MTPRNRLEPELIDSPIGLAPGASPNSKAPISEPSTLVAYKELKVNWVNVAFFTTSTLLAAYGVLYVPFQSATVVAMVLLYGATMLGITAGK